MNALIPRPVSEIPERYTGTIIVKSHGHYGCALIRGGYLIHVSHPTSGGESIHSRREYTAKEHFSDDAFWLPVIDIANHIEEQNKEKNKSSNSKCQGNYGLPDVESPPPIPPCKPPKGIGSKKA